MSKHRKKRHYRQITIAAVAIGAVGVPSVAMACLDGQENTGGRHHGQWRNASADHRWSKGEKEAKRRAKASPAPAASPSAAKATAKASGATARVVELVNNERRKAAARR